MAVVENIREQKQTPSAQRGVIDYCCCTDKTHLDEKTVFEIAPMSYDEIDT